MYDANYELSDISMTSIFNGLRFNLSHPTTIVLKNKNQNKLNSTQLNCTFTFTSYLLVNSITCNAKFLTIKDPCVSFAISIVQSILLSLSYVSINQIMKRILSLHFYEMYLDPYLQMSDMVLINFNSNKKLLTRKQFAFQEKVLCRTFILFINIYLLFWC